MKPILRLISLAALIVTTPTQAGGKDDPVLSKIMIDQFEKRYADGKDPLILEADAWIGQDLNKAWFKIDAEHVDGELEELELQVLYSRAIDPYWDLQIGWRHDDKPVPQRDWLAIGVKGLAPYWFETDAALFIGGNGQVNARLQAEYEWMLTQRWVLSPEVEASFYSDDDPAHDIGAGLSKVQAGLRLRYEIKREIAPYIGFNWTGKFGDTADFAKTMGKDARDSQFVVGVRTWF